MVRPCQRNHQAQLKEVLKYHEGPMEKSYLMTPYQLHSIPEGLHRFESARNYELDRRKSMFLDDRVG